MSSMLCDGKEAGMEHLQRDAKLRFVLGIFVCPVK